MSLNQILKKLQIHKSTYYRWLLQNKKFATNQPLEKAIYKMCYQYAFVANHIPIMRLGYRRICEVFQKFRHFLFFKNSLRLTIK
ncbi:hypothetical protein [Candidatus Phytoplasma solani]|uniref:hypothetical protein n=1 Tax=Candidatus Phytoplasma solani TaxID=69896 RepID=UPI00358FE65D